MPDAVIASQLSLQIGMRTEEDVAAVPRFHPTSINQTISSSPPALATMPVAWSPECVTLCRGACESEC